MSMADLIQQRSDLKTQLAEIEAKIRSELQVAADAGIQPVRKTRSDAGKQRQKLETTPE